MFHSSRNNESSEDGEDQESIESSTKPDPGYQMGKPDSDKCPIKCLSCQDSKFKRGFVVPEAILLSSGPGQFAET